MRRFSVRYWIITRPKASCSGIAGSTISFAGASSWIATNAVGPRFSRAVWANAIVASAVPAATAASVLTSMAIVSFGLGCVLRENEVASFGRLVAGEAGFVQCFVGRFAVLKVTESPAARRGVLFRVLDHNLRILGGPGNERLRAAKDFVVFLRWDVIPMQRHNDGAIRERKLSFPIGLHRYIVAQLGANIVEVAFFVGHGDQLPVAVSGGNFYSVDRGGLSIGLSRCGGHVGDHAGKHHNCNQPNNNPSHTAPSSNTSSLQPTLGDPSGQK